MFLVLCVVGAVLIVCSWFIFHLVFVVLSSSCFVLVLRSFWCVAGGAVLVVCWLRNSDYELVVRSLLCVCDVVLVVCFGGVVFIVLVVQSLLCVCCWCFSCFVLVVWFLLSVGG